MLAAERRVAELERVSAEAKAKAKAERTNEDIALRAIRVCTSVYNDPEKHWKHSSICSTTMKVLAPF